MTKLYPPYDKLNQGIVAGMYHVLSQLGIVNKAHTGLTADRLIYYLQYLTEEDPRPFHLTVFPNVSPAVDHMVVVPHISFWAACSHHCLPFFGTASVGYIPHKVVVGLSKVPLLVRKIARGYWLQEHLANEIADQLEFALDPLGVAIQIRAQHTCQLLDLQQPPIPEMVTTVLRGRLFKGEARAEFFSTVAGGD